MAVETTDIKSALLACNGSVTTFPFTFPILATGDLKVYLITNATEAKELLTETTDYSVSATNDDYSSGGNVETVSTYSSAYSILIVRDVTNTQTTDYTVGDDLDADVLESDFDRRTMVAQEFAELLSRMLSFPVQDPTTISGEMAPQADRLGKFVYFDATYGQPVMVDAIALTDAPVTDFGKTLLDDEDAIAAMKTLQPSKDLDSANYTVQDDDGFRLIRVTTGASDRTITLPTAADNVDRILHILKDDSGAGLVIVDGESAERIDGAMDITIVNRYDSVTLYCDGADWFVLNNISAFSRTLVDGIDAAAANKTLTSIHSPGDANYTILDDDGYTDFLFALVTTARTLTLPTAAANTGREVYAKIISNTSGTLTIDGEGAELINGIATWQLRGAGDWIHLICDGTGWHVRGHYETALIYQHTADFSQNTPTQNQWYAVTNFLLALPTGGVWQIEFGSMFWARKDAGPNVFAELTCADGSASEDDDEYTMRVSTYKQQDYGWHEKTILRTFASGVTLYVNLRTASASCESVASFDAEANGHLRARRIA